MFPLLVPHQFPAPVGEGNGVGSVLCFHTCYWRDIRAVILYTVPHPSPFTVICMKGILLTPPRPLPYRGGEPTRDGAVHHFHQQFWKILWWLRFLLLPLQRLQLKQAFEPNLLQTLHLGDFLCSYLMPVFFAFFSFRLAFSP